MQKNFKEDETNPNPIWDRIQKVINPLEEKKNADFTFSKYKVPLIKISKEKEENKLIKEKKKQNLLIKKKIKKKLPFYSKERIYERDLKILVSGEIVKFLNQYNKIERDEPKKNQRLRKKKRITKRKKKEEMDSKVFGDN